jgi:alpha-tubulin suppressor-like RCC1 family protein
VLLTETGQTKALSARVLDSTGREITATVSWESTQPGQISVTSAGQVTALGDGGSGQITARVGELRSAPLMVFHSQVPAGSLLLTDAQIVGEPEETTPDATPSINNTYRVRLSGVAAPAVGQLVMNTEAKIVVGRVRAVSTDANGVHTVTLGLVPLREALPTLRINETIDLSQAPVTVPADVLANYDVAHEGTRYTFTPKFTAAAARAASQRASGAKARAAAASGTSALPPFKECEFTVEGAGGAGSLPIQLDKVPGFTVEFKPALDMVHTPEGGLERLVLSTEPTVTTDLSLEFTAGFDAKLTCDIDLLVVRIPTPGPVAAFLSGLITLGAGMELSGKVELPGAKLGSVTQRSTTLDVGLACPNGGRCSLVHDVGATTVTSKATVEGPDLNDVRLEPSLFGYGKATASIGNPFFASLRFDAFYAKLGVALQTSLASREGQITDAEYKSQYGIAALLKAGLETEFEGLAAWLGLNGVAENLVELDAPLASSPTGSVTVAQESFSAGESVEATVNFTDGTTFLGLYNVDEVILMRKVGTAAAQEVARSTVTDGLTQLTLSFTPASDGTASELYAFVATRALPAHPLELGQGQARPLVNRIAAGDVFTCALDSSGIARCWGWPLGLRRAADGNGAQSGTPAVVEGLGSVRSITAGALHACAITAAGAVKCWGYDGGGAPLNGDSTSPAVVTGLDSGVAVLDAGRGHTCVVTTTGAVKCWGSNDKGQLGNGASGDSSATPVSVAGLSSGVAAVSAGNDHACALTSAGGVRCWGVNTFGQLGRGDTVPSPTPVNVTGLSSGVKAIASGSGYSCALTTAGAVQCWGANDALPFANGTPSRVSTVPVPVAGLGSGVAAIAANSHHTCALLDTGAVKCWGSNDYGQLGDGSFSHTNSGAVVDVQGLGAPAVEIAVGLLHSCAFVRGGGLRCWGSNSDGELGIGSVGSAEGGVMQSVVPVDVIGFP